MTSLTDFHTWLAKLPALGYDRDWIRRNEPVLRERFENDPSPMQPCPEPPSKRVRDRYTEI